MDSKRHRVETTNDSALISKYSMSRKHYVSDPFLEYFVSAKDLKRSRSPLINRFYYLRFKAIEYALNRNQDLNEMISFGCGFDTCALRFPNIKFIEIDFPIVALNKAKILIDNQLIALNENYLKQNDLNFMDSTEPTVVFRTENYCLIGADLRKYEILSDFLIKKGFVNHMNRETRIGLFNECSLCYLTQEVSDGVMRAFTDLFGDKCHSIRYIGFEQMKSNQINNGFSTVMLNHFQTIGSPLKTFLTKSEIINRFKVGLSFQSIEVLDLKTFFDDYIETNEKQRIDSLEMFDEYEEFDSVCSCYALTIAQMDCNNISNKQNNQLIKPNINFEINRQIKPIVKSIENSSLLSRFGQTSCLTNDNKIVTFGGFGCDFDERKQLNDRISHKRLSNLVKIDPKSDEILNFNSCDNSNQMQRIHSRIVEIKDNLYFISGGRGSPSSVMDNKIIKVMSESHEYETQSIKEITNSVPNVFRHLIVKQLNTNKIIQFGGKQSNNSYDTCAEDNAFYILDTNTMKWQKQTQKNLFSRIHSHSGVSLNSNVFLTNGGLICGLNTFNSNSFDLIDERISFVNSIKVNDMKHLYSHSIKQINENKLLIIGGMSKTGPNNRIDLLDLRSNKIMDSFDIITESPLILTNFSSEIVMSDSGSPFLWLIGGGGNCFSFGTHFNKLSVLELFCL